MTIPSDRDPSAPDWLQRHGSPLEVDGARVPLYSPAFAVDAQRMYRQMRARYGPLVPVELAPGVLPAAERLPQLRCRTHPLPTGQYRRGRRVDLHALRGTVEKVASCPFRRALATLPVAFPPAR